MVVLGGWRFILSEVLLRVSDYEPMTILCPMWEMGHERAVSFAYQQGMVGNFDGMVDDFG